jgi:hypothetical protein
VEATLANGNHYANDYCLVIELEDGLVHRVREYVDPARGHRTASVELPSRRTRSGRDPARPPRRTLRRRPKPGCARIGA